MHRIHLHYTIASDPAPALIRNPLLDLLQAVSRMGSISAAARETGFSYRHVWGQLRRWESELGQTLIVWEKGQPAHLTEFGTRLMWAERQAQARLQPQIEALRAGLERAYAVAFDDDAHVLTLYASHDDALAALAEHARARRLHLDIRFTGSVDAIRALNEGRCALAGFHTREPAGRGTLTQRTYKPLLRPGLHEIIGFARRTQGLIVAPGNPRGLRSIGDVGRSGARFANRATGSGTRVLVDELLAEAGLAPIDIRGYADAEPSQAAVACAVASGQADAGFGTAAMAHAFDLGFVPLVAERYHFACLKSSLEQPAVRTLLDLLASAEWQSELAALPGYAPERCGQVLPLRHVLPWAGRGREA